ncbi:MAG TPA: ABC transporter permease [Terriglobales bacterium]|nr:ABC transporter permease [Terriglobales bacterium]
METFTQDLRYGMRMLRRSPGAAAIAVLTLALGIGANAGIFSLVNSVLLRPLPYPEPGQLVRVFTVLPTQPHFPIAVADFYDYRQRTSVFSSSALYAERDLDLTLTDRPEHLSGMGVTHEYFRVLGYHPAVGGDFDEKEEYKNNNHVVILSDRFWRTHFDADPNIVGKTLQLSGEPYTVIAVMPSGVQHVGGDFHTPAHGDTVDLWWPLALEPHKPDGCDRGCHYLNMVARLKPGVTVAAASAAMNAVAEQLGRELPGYDGHMLIVPLKEEIVGRARLMLTVLMGTVAFLLLIACVNVANLALARATSRYREIAIRSVLGAAGMRIIRQLLTESFLIAVLGCLFGLLFAELGVRGLVALSPEKLPRLQFVHIDARVLLFAAAITVLTVLLFGLAPALALAKTNANESLKEGDRAATSGGTRVYLRSALVSAEIALALILLTGAALLLRTFMNLQHVDPGFNPAGALTFQLQLPSKRYPEQSVQIRFYQQLAERLRALPGVQSVGIGSDIPWTGYDENSSFQLAGVPFDPNHSPEARYHFASPDYFRALGIPLLSGRFFERTDDPKAPHVAVVNAAFAQKFFPGQDAVGKRLDLWGFKGTTIVGVIGDVKDTPDAASAKPAFYWADWQFSDGDERIVTVRASSNLNSLAAALPKEILVLDKDLPITGVRTLDEVGAHAIATARFSLLLVGTFAGLALILAAIGIFGVVSYSVTQRTHEIGIRMALGASHENVLKMILKQNASFAIFGVAIGLLAAFGLTRVMRGLLYHVSTSDPWTFAAVALGLVVIALIACYIPARRALNVEPLAALRYE